MVQSSHTIERAPRLRLLHPTGRRRVRTDAYACREGGVVTEPRVNNPRHNEKVGSGCNICIVESDPKLLPRVLSFWTRCSALQQLSLSPPTTISRTIPTPSTLGNPSSNRWSTSQHRRRVEAVRHVPEGKIRPAEYRTGPVVLTISAGLNNAESSRVVQPYHTTV